MKNLALTLGLIIIIVGGITFALTRNNKSIEEKGDTVYCLPDGTLSKTQPIQSHRSYCIISNARVATFLPNTSTTYSFSILDDQANTLKDFAITHTKPMHVIVVRKDLSHFQHLHPEFNNQTGEFTLHDLTFPGSGDYRIFGDFAAGNGPNNYGMMSLPITLSDDITIPGEYSPKTLGTEERTKTIDGYTVSLSTDQPPVSGKEIQLSFNLKKDGKPIVDLEEYLGALGHSVILREGSLDFIHAHPTADAKQVQNGKVDFMVYFPEAGKYKIFTQFQRSGKVFTTDFVVSVTQGEPTTSGEPATEHSMHH